MNLKKYRDYIKDNPEGYWFKRRFYGWGWFPVKWQGWLVVLAFVLILILNSIYLILRAPEGTNPSTLDFIIFFGVIIISIGIMILIAYKKGEKPKWNWGL